MESKTGFCTAAFLGLPLLDGSWLLFGLLLPALAMLRHGKLF